MTALQRTAMEARRELELLRRQQRRTQQQRAAEKRRDQEKAQIARALRKLPLTTLREIADRYLP